MNNYSIDSSLNNDQIHVYITNTTNFSQYEGSFKERDLRLNFDLDEVYNIMLKCFNKENGYGCSITTTECVMKIRFNANIGGLLTLKFELLLREKEMTDDKQIICKLNSELFNLKKRYEELERQLSYKNKEKDNLIIENHKLDKLCNEYLITNRTLNAENLRLKTSLSQLASEKDDLTIKTRILDHRCNELEQKLLDKDKEKNEYIIANRENLKLKNRLSELYNMMHPESNEELCSGATCRETDALVNCPRFKYNFKIESNGNVDITRTCAWSGQGDGPSEQLFRSTDSIPIPSYFMTIITMLVTGLTSIELKNRETDRTKSRNLERYNMTNYTYNVRHYDLVVDIIKTIKNDL